MAKVAATVSGCTVWLRRHWFFIGSLALGLSLPILPIMRALDYPLSLLASPALATLSIILGILGGHGEGPPRRWLPDLTRVGAGSVVVAFPALVASVLSGAVCEPLYGLQFWLLGPFSSGVMGLVLGRSLRVFVRPGLALGLVPVLILVGPAIALAEFFWTPGVRFYGSLYGLYHGAIYDEAVFVEWPYLWLRIWNSVGAGALTLFICWRQRPTRPRLAFLLAAVLAWLTMTALGDHLGFVNRGARLDAELSGIHQTAHFDVRFTPGGRGEEWAPLVGADLEFRRTQVARFYGLKDPAQHITAYLYENSAQKARLMGAGRTSIAKPWLGQLHIHAHEVGGRLLHHELTHVMLAPLSASLLAMPTHSWGLPRPGLLEGAAVAAERGEGTLTTHQWAKAMRDIELLPDMPVMLESLSFWSQSSSRAYTACGSFVRFLVETRGPGPFARLYGGASYEEAYNESLDSLLRGWHGFLDGVSLVKEDLQLAEFAFSRPPVFHRQCPYAGGRCLEQARRLAGGKGPPAAVAPLAALGLRLTGSDLFLGQRLVRVLLAVDQTEAADALLELIRRAHPSPGEVANQALALIQADILWLSGATDRARDEYSALLDSAFARLVSPALEHRLALLVEDGPRDLTRLVTGAVTYQELPGILDHLEAQLETLLPAGRLQVVTTMARFPQLHQHALRLLLEIPRQGIPDSLRSSRETLALQLALVTGRLAVARETLGEQGRRGQTPPEREARIDWQERIDWLAGSTRNALP
jgi:hypothetical protein